MADLELIISYVHNPCACDKHDHKLIPEVFPSVFILKAEGDYGKLKNKIDKAVDVVSRVVILQILSVSSVNLSELKELLGYSYSTIRDAILLLKRLKIVDAVPGKSKKGKRELKVSLKEPFVKVIPLSEKEEKVKMMLDKEISTSEREFDDFKNWVAIEIKKALEKKYASKKTIR